MKALIFAAALIAIVPLTVAAHNGNDVLVEFSRSYRSRSSVRSHCSISPNDSTDKLNSAVSNVVRGAPGGVPWHIHHFSAEVNVDGSIQIVG